MDVDQTIRGSMADLMERTEGAFGAEVRCSSDFYRVRVQQILQQLLAKLQNKTIPPLEPQFCQTVPDRGIDLNFPEEKRKTLQYWGYDFDKATVSVFLITQTGEKNVTEHLYQNTHYEMTLNLASNGGVAPDKNSKSISLRWNGKEVSGVPVIQAASRICKKETKPVYIPPFDVVPLLTADSGDAEFGGNGPQIWFNTKVYIAGDRKSLKLYADMTANETNHGNTKSFVKKDVVVYNADPGWYIESIVAPNPASWAYSYTDTDHEDDDVSDVGLVLFVKFRGDHGGDDVGEGEYTGAFNVTLKNITILVKEIPAENDCIAQ